MIAAASLWDALWTCRVRVSGGDGRERPRAASRRGGHALPAAASGGSAGLGRGPRRCRSRPAGRGSRGGTAARRLPLRSGHPARGARPPECRAAGRKTRSLVIQASTLVGLRSARVSTVRMLCEHTHGVVWARRKGYARSRNKQRASPASPRLQRVGPDEPDEVAEACKRDALERVPVVVGRHLDELFAGLHPEVDPRLQGSDPPGALHH
mmetsp:Transcript_34982/g.112844  ORF Transcript_34982/g.112844 Transcript_34982/m.112844 type:complete len:210 (+) Transcript_34982:760-1389(+)